MDGSRSFPSRSRMSFLPVNIVESRGRALRVATPRTASPVVGHQLKHVEMATGRKLTTSIGCTRMSPRGTCDRATCMKWLVREPNIGTKMVCEYLYPMPLHGCTTLEVEKKSHDMEVVKRWSRRHSLVMIWLPPTTVTVLPCTTRFWIPDIDIQVYWQ